MTAWLLVGWVWLATLGWIGAVVAWSRTWGAWASAEANAHDNGGNA